MAFWLAILVGVLGIAHAISGVVYWRLYQAFLRQARRLAELERRG